MRTGHDQLVFQLVKIQLVTNSVSDDSVSDGFQLVTFQLVKIQLVFVPVSDPPVSNFVTNWS